MPAGSSASECVLLLPSFRQQLWHEHVGHALPQCMSQVGQPPMSLQAMDMISIAQSSGDISADIYRQKSAKPVETPQLAGLEKHHQKLLAQAQAEQNPFTNGASSSARTLPDSESLLDI